MQSLFSVFTFLAYGLAFFSLGIIILVYPRRAIRFNLAGSLGLIGLFGIFHGINEWIDITHLLLIREPALLQAARLVFLPLSFFCLLRFGVKALAREKAGRPLLRQLPAVLLAAWAVLVFASGQKMVTADVLARYLLGLPGSFLTAYALWVHVPEFSGQKRPGAVLAIKISAVAFIAYGILTGLIVPRAGFFPASVLNVANFAGKLHIPAGWFPIQWLRTSCAIVLCFTMGGILKIFEWETVASLSQSEQKYRSLYESMMDGFVFLDMEGGIKEYNESFRNMLGYSPGELSSLTCQEITPEKWHDSEGRIIEGQILPRGYSDVYEKEYRKKDGTVFPIELRKFLIKNKKGEANGMWAIVRDISERKEAEWALRQSEEFIRNVLDSVDDGFIVVDRDLRIMAANRAYCASSKSAMADILGRHCYEVSHKALRSCDMEGEDCAVKKVFETGQPNMALHQHTDANGNIVFVETKAFPMKDASGAVTSVIETIHDITERRLLEKEQLKSHKLEAIGTLAGGIAHDFNNLLQGVFGYISLAKAGMDHEGKSFASLERAEKALRQATNLTRQLLTFSKGGKPVKSKIELLPVMENAASFALSGSRSEYRITADKGLWHIEADEGQIGQVVQNIVLNASEAMPEGGTVELFAGNANVPKGSKPLLPDGGKFVKAVIRDAGGGIPEQHLSRIFDPYFTTKQNGSGLGLATSYSIIRNHGGVIEVDSQMNKGTAFTIYLPAHEGGVEESGCFSFQTEARKGKVLLMDDDEIVRDVAVRMLVSLGHETEAAESGEEAIEKFRQAAGAGIPFDVVILDLTVKRGMGGEQAIAKIKEIDPAVEAIVSSGYSDNPVVAAYRSFGFSAFLNKPYIIESLRDSLNDLLGQ